MVKCSVFVASLMLSTILAASGFTDWNEFRGPSGQGHADVSTLSIHWSETENILWKTAVDGLAWSSPVVSGERIYLTSAVSQNEDRQSLQLVCLDLTTGELQWSKQLFEQAGEVQIHTKNSHASPTPVIDGDRIYAHFGPHGTACVSLEGDLIWKQRLEYEPVHGNGGSPALAGNVLVICCDGGDQQYVVGLNKQDGEIIWRTERETDPKKGFSFCTPLVIEVHGKSQAVCPGSDAVFAYDPQNGDEIWRVDYPDGYSVTPRPVYGNGLVYVCTGFNRPSLLAIDPTGAGNLTETHVRWNLDRKMPKSPSPILAGGEIYTVSDDGFASCIDALTGEVHWQERLAGNFSASPLSANGLIYFQDELGTTIVVKAAKDFEEIARNSLEDGQRTFASFAVAGNSILLRSESHLYRIGTSGN